MEVEVSVMTTRSSSSRSDDPDPSRAIALKWLGLARISLYRCEIATPVFGQGTPGFGLDTSVFLN